MHTTVPGGEATLTAIKTDSSREILRPKEGLRMTKFARFRIGSTFSVNNAWLEAMLFYGSKLVWAEPRTML
jgi:hypothetical protein